MKTKLWVVVLIAFSLGGCVTKGRLKQELKAMEATVKAEMLPAFQQLESNRLSWEQDYRAIWDKYSVLQEELTKEKAETKKANDAVQKALLMQKPTKNCSGCPASKP